MVGLNDDENFSTRQKRPEQRLQRRTLDLENTVAEGTKSLSLINKELGEKSRQLEKANHRTTHEILEDSGIIRLYLRGGTLIHAFEKGI